MNLASSRSHLLIYLRLVKRMTQSIVAASAAKLRVKLIGSKASPSVADDRNSIHAQLVIADLAGSERMDRTQLDRHGDAKRAVEEAKSINTDLHILTHCLTVLR